MKTTAAIAAAILGTVAAIPTVTPAIHLELYAKPDCSGPVVPGSAPQNMVFQSGNCLVVGTDSMKVTEITASPLTYRWDIFGGTTCAGSVVGTMAVPKADTCTATGTGIGIKVKKFGGDDKGVAFRFFSDSSCNTASGLPKPFTAAPSNAGISNSFSNHVCTSLPSASSLMFDVTGEMMEVKAWLGTSATCDTTKTSASLKAAPGKCTKLDAAALAANQQMGLCKAGEDCWVYVWPVGFAGPGAGMSAASTSTLATVIVAGAVVAAALLA